MKKIFLFFLYIFILSGCANNTPQKNSLNIVTSFYPIYIITSNITKGVENINLTNMAQPQTGCLHDYQLSPNDLKKLSTSDIFIINGGDMEGFLNNAMSLLDLNILNSSTNILFLENDHHNHESENNHHNHESEENSHIWLNPKNAKMQAENIKNGLIEFDSENKEIYEYNYKIFANSMDNLISKFDELNSNKKIYIGTFHEGFDYFSDMCGFENKVEIFFDENKQTSAHELADAIDTVIDNNIKILLAADDEGKNFAKLISNETDAKVYILNPITSGDMTSDSYYNLMDNNISVLKEAIKNEYPQ